MIAKSFKSVGWVAGVAAAAIGCYILSLKVAAERAELASVERRIVATHQAIRNLQTELGTRGRMTQLESWNAEVLALSAPVAGQFVENEVVLARLETRTQPLDEAAAQVRMASAETGPAQPAPQRAVAAAPAPAPQAVVRRASLTTEAPRPRSEPEPRRAPAASARTPRPARPRTPPVRASALLDERTARELIEAARAEQSDRRETGTRPAGGGERSRRARAE